MPFYMGNCFDSIMTHSFEMRIFRHKVMISYQHYSGKSKLKNSVLFLSLHVVPLLSEEKKKNPLPHVSTPEIFIG